MPKEKKRMGFLHAEFSQLETRDASSKLLIVVTDNIHFSDAP
jgi:hypothetical protein